MLIHELTHVDQHYSNNNDSWLTEGIADYVRHKYFEKDIELQFAVNLDDDGKVNNFLFATEGYRVGYRVTGAFLFWLEDRKDKDIVAVLNQALRNGRYSKEIFQTRCNATLDDLWLDFLAQSKA